MERLKWFGRSVRSLLAWRMERPRAQELIYNREGRGVQVMGESEEPARWKPIIKLGNATSGASQGREFNIIVGKLSREWGILSPWVS